MLFAAVIFPSLQPEPQKASEDVNPPVPATGPGAALSKEMAESIQSVLPSAGEASPKDVAPSAPTPTTFAVAPKTAPNFFPAAPVASLGTAFPQSPKVEATAPALSQAPSAIISTPVGTVQPEAAAPAVPAVLQAQPVIAPSVVVHTPPEPLAPSMPQALPEIASSSIVHTQPEVSQAAQPVTHQTPVVPAQPEAIQPAPISPQPEAAPPAQVSAPIADGAPRPTIPKPKPKRIGDILIEDGFITPQQLEQALQEGKATNSPLGAVLNKLGYIDEITLGKALAKLHGLLYIDTSTIDIDPEVMKLIPVDFIKRHMVVPYRMDKAHKRIEVIMARPDNLHILDEVALLTGYRPIPRVSTHKELVALLDKFYRNRASADDAMARLEEDFSKQDSNYDQGGLANDLEAEMAADDAPVVQLVNSILIDALDNNASDIHIEPQKERLLVRFRIDGILREVRSIPKKMGAAFVSRIKVASGMDIAERRRPQDGRMKLKEGSMEVDMRVNSLATQFGEKIVIRLLRANATTGGIEKLGLSNYEAKRIDKMIHSPHGIILVTGPTGSGKTTTLYSCLREINSPERNITTIEDPVEYPLPGVNQTQVSSKSGLTFSLCLRAILRQDPDVVMVGEIRDHETLEAAIHASLTGHLVFSTLHTNSAAKTITRLLEMGAPAYLVSTAVIGILAQRLVRRTCTNCKVEYTTPEDEMATLGITDPITLIRGEGCEKCDKTGYSGRVGLYEIMMMNREVQELVTAGASTFQIQDAAIKNGMLTLGMDGKRKIYDGMTTVAEVTRVLGLDLEEK